MASAEALAVLVARGVVELRNGGIYLNARAARLLVNAPVLHFMLIRLTHTNAEAY